MDALKYLRLNGELTDSQAYSILDFIKLNLLVPSGAVYNNFQYGYEYLNINDKTSIENAIKRIINTFNYNISIESIEMISEKRVVVRFTGIEDELVLGE